MNNSLKGITGGNISPQALAHCSAPKKTKSPQNAVSSKSHKINDTADIKSRSIKSHKPAKNSSKEISRNEKTMRHAAR